MELDPTTKEEEKRMTDGVWDARNANERQNLTTYIYIDIGYRAQHFNTTDPYL